MCLNLTGNGEQYQNQRSLVGVSSCSDEMMLLKYKHLVSHNLIYQRCSRQLLLE